MLRKKIQSYSLNPNKVLYLNNLHVSMAGTSYETHEVISNNYETFDDGCCLRSTAVDFDAMSVQWHDEMLSDQKIVAALLL